MRASLLSLVLLAACASGAPGASEDEIVMGTRETGYPEVVAVAWMTGPMMGGLCSGTVIGPYAVLTAKHCVFQDLGTSYTPVAARDFVVLVGDDVNTMAGIDSYHYVSEVRTTPGSDIDTDVAYGTDIAILLLQRDIGITARSVASSGPSFGDPITIVGFGQTDTAATGGAGVKYRGSTTVSIVMSRVFGTAGGSWTCHGDSGGPAIDASGAVTGITSFGRPSRSGPCARSESYFTRVSAHATLIADALTFVPPCIPNPESCNGIDDDCNGRIDEIACEMVGEPCASSSDCMSAACQSVGGTMICVEECFPDDPAVGCPAGQYCEATGCGAGRCVVGAVGAGAAGAECTSDLECATGHCADLGGVRRCGLQCFPDAACGAGEVCEVPAGEGCGACIPLELSTRPRPYGAACTDDAQCASGDCSASGGDGFCTMACTAHSDCGDGNHCRAGTCARGAPSPEGGACAFDDDCDDALACASGVCSASGGPRTGGGCSAAGPSPLPALLLGLTMLAFVRRRR